MKAVVRRIARVLSFVVLPAALLVACDPGPINGQGYQVVFEDNFDGTAPDPTVWATAPFGGSSPATVSGGLLTVEATAANGYRWGYLASTGPRSSAEPSYPGMRAWQEGYFEARIRYTDNPWSWPALWLFSATKSEAWPGEDCSHLNSEWDIMENGVQNGPGTRPANSWYFTNLHRNTTDNTADGYCGQPDMERQFSRDFTGTNLSDWHVWSGRWTADQLCTYLDDVEIRCTEPWDTTAQPMHLTLTMQYLGRCDGCPSRPSALQMQVDLVRVWQKP